MLLRLILNVILEEVFIERLGSTIVRTESESRRVVTLDPASDMLTSGCRYCCENLNGAQIYSIFWTKRLTYRVVLVMIAYT